MKTLLIVLSYFAVATPIACWVAPKQEIISQMKADYSYTRVAAEDPVEDTVSSILLADETVYSVNEYDGQMSVETYNDSIRLVLKHKLDSAGANYVMYLSEPDSAYVFVWDSPQFIPWLEPAPKLTRFIHHCEWMSCKFEGKSEFITAEEEGSDFYYFLLNHFTHPSWSEDECEAHIWE